MKTYKSSDLTHKRAEVLEEAEANGVIIQQLKTNGAVVNELVITSKRKLLDDYHNLASAFKLVFDIDITAVEYDALIKLTR